MAYDVRQILICRQKSALHKYATDHLLPHKAFRSWQIYLIIPFFLIWLRLFQPVLLHCHESKGHTVGVITRLLSFLRIVVVVHRRVLFPVKNRLTSRCKYSEKVVDKIICISHAVEKVVHETAYNVSTEVIPSSVSFDRTIAPGEVDLSRDYGIDPEKMVVAYIAALTYEKDHFTFLNTANEILKQTHDVHFLIIGDGPLYARIKDKARRMNIFDYVTFTGFVRDAERLIPQIDLLLFTSTSEGLGSTILDFFVYEKPVVSTMNGGAGELIENGVTGFLSPIGDFSNMAKQVLNLKNSPILVSKITRNAKQYVIMNHSMKAVAERTIGVYRALEQ